MTQLVRLSTGAEIRIRNGAAPLALVLVNGGSARPVPGTWSATSELLAVRARASLPGHRVRRGALPDQVMEGARLCLEDAVAALDLLDRPALLVGFSMGGAVSIGVAADPRVAGVLGLAPWIPDRAPPPGARRQEARRPPRLVGSLPAGNTRRQRRELAARVRPRPCPRRRRHLHVDPPRPARGGATPAIRGDLEATAVARLARRGRGSASRSTRVKRAFGARADSPSAAARSTRDRASRGSGS